MQQLQRLPLQRIRPFLQLGLVLLLAYILARLSWQLWPQPTANVLSPIVSHSGQQQSSPGRVDLASLQSFALFGKPQAEPVAKAVVAVVADAPKTNLNVKLTGVVAVLAEPQRGSAIIENRGTEATYAVDDTIEGTNAILKQVMEDRVLLQVAGRFETLMLDGVEFTRIAQANAGLGREDNIDDNSMQDMQPEQGQLIQSPEPMDVSDDVDLQVSREEIMAEPMKFFDYVRVSPQHRNGQLVGYRLMPGRDPALFNRLGLQQNDLAVEINGIALNDMQQAMNVISALRDASEASIKVERDGEVRDILFSLSQ